MFKCKSLKIQIFNIFQAKTKFTVIVDVYKRRFTNKKEKYSEEHSQLYTR